MEENGNKVAGKKIDCILLLDDNEADNDWHYELINNSEVANQAIIIDHPLEAVTYFKNCLTEEPNEKFRVPDLVFLDLYMPAINGFELLDHFKKLTDPYQRKKKIKFVLLTGHVNPENSLRARTDYGDLVIATAEKPLDTGTLSAIAEKYF